jgi:hypothetical protein
MTKLGVERRRIHLQQEQPSERVSGSKESGFKSNQESHNSLDAVDRAKKKISASTPSTSSSNGLARPKSRKIRRIKGYNYWGQIPSHAKRMKKPVAIVAPSTSSLHVICSSTSASRNQQNASGCSESVQQELPSRESCSDNDREPVSCVNGDNGGSQRSRPDLPLEKKRHTSSSKKDGMEVQTCSAAAEEADSEAIPTNIENSQPVPEEKRYQQPSEPAVPTETIPTVASRAGGSSEHMCSVFLLGLNFRINCFFR